MGAIRIKLELDTIANAAKEFLDKTQAFKQFAFYGDMGAGKTTFINALCNELKALDLISSPTFSIVNEYETESGELIHHFDFYRIKDPVELYDIGFEEYIDADAYCFIEWPEKAEHLLPETFINVRIDVLGNGARELVFNLQ
jgi:tRNA threonylcarbamoyladenosine biosynthesis protein TsaE